MIKYVIGFKLKFNKTKKNIKINELENFFQN